MMKIMLAYDGSDHAAAALDDLRRAGLPPEAEALVLSVVKPVLPLMEPSIGLGMPLAELSLLTQKEATEMAKQAGQRLQAIFPGWQTRSESYAALPVLMILQKAEQWQPDLIVIGSRGRSALGRLLFGSVSQKVVNEAPCSVRIAHGRVGTNDFIARNLIWIDGSADAEAAVREVASRAWSPETEARLVISMGPSGNPETALPEAELTHVQALKRSYEAELRAAGLKVSSVIKPGKASETLLEEAEGWGADCIFVGTHSLSFFNRLWPGSVTKAVATKANCSVEVVRAKWGQASNRSRFPLTASAA
jgi:nucleotide-binding universal stress UspA family protein